MIVWFPWCKVVILVINIFKGLVVLLYKFTRTKEWQNSYVAPIMTLTFDRKENWGLILTLTHYEVISHDPSYVLKLLFLCSVLTWPIFWDFVWEQKGSSSRSATALHRLLPRRNQQGVTAFSFSENLTNPIVPTENGAINILTSWTIISLSAAPKERKWWLIV